eukprot:3774321-Rhodomonas_salina.2
MLRARVLEVRPSMGRAQALREVAAALDEVLQEWNVPREPHVALPQRDVPGAQRRMRHHVRVVPRQRLRQVVEREDRGLRQSCPDQARQRRLRR